MTPDERIKNAKNVVNAFTVFTNVLAAVGNEFNRKRIDADLQKLRRELNKQSNAIILDAKTPPPPREANVILDEIRDKGRATPAVIEEINRLLGE